MRISDWSSDVCSSDLVEKLRLEPDFIAVRLFGIGRRCSQRKRIEIVSERRERTDLVVERPRLEAMRVGCVDEQVIGRSEEHTSELQSLMRISYAVFCLKKKNTTK